MGIQIRVWTYNNHMMLVILTLLVYIISVVVIIGVISGDTSSIVLDGDSSIGTNWLLC